MSSLPTGNNRVWKREPGHVPQVASSTPPTVEVLCSFHR